VIILLFGAKVGRFETQKRRFSSLQRFLVTSTCIFDVLTHFTRVVMFSTYISEWRNLGKKNGNLSSELWGRWTGFFHIITLTKKDFC
jgi:hypothetical protein